MLLHAGAPLYKAMQLLLRGKQHDRQVGVLVANIAGNRATTEVGCVAVSGLVILKTVVQQQQAWSVCLEPLFNERCCRLDASVRPSRIAQQVIAALVEQASQERALPDVVVD